MVLKADEMKIGQLYKFVNDDMTNLYVGKFFEAKESLKLSGEIIFVVKFDDNGKIVELYRGNIKDDDMIISGFVLSGWKISPTTCDVETLKKMADPTTAKNSLFICNKLEVVKGSDLERLISEIKEFYHDPETYFDKAKQLKKEL